MSDEVFTFDCQKKEASAPDRALLAFTPLELGLLKKSLAPGRTRSPILGGMTTVTQYPGFFLVGPILGAPQAAMALEILRRRGVTTYVSLGWCGSLSSRLALGDIVLPISALSEEGTSAHYPLSHEPAEADPNLTDSLSQALARRNIPFAAGRVWTTDAPYRETWGQVRRYAAQGLLAVDMETSALIAVSRFRGLAWAGLMVVSDELWREKWRQGFKSEELKNGLIRAGEAVLTVIAGRPE